MTLIQPPGQVDDSSLNMAANPHSGAPAITLVRSRHLLWKVVPQFVPEAELNHSKDLFDIILACDGGKIRTHNIVLFKISLYFAYRKIAFLLLDVFLFCYLMAKDLDVWE